MADLLTEVTGFMNLSLGTVGTTDITIGLIAVFALISGSAVSLFKRIRGRG